MTLGNLNKTNRAFSDPSGKAIITSLYLFQAFKIYKSPYIKFAALELHSFAEVSAKNKFAIPLINYLLWSGLMLPLTFCIFDEHFPVPRLIIQLLVKLLNFGLCVSSRPSRT